MKTAGIVDQSETVFKPLSELEAAINAASAGDFLLLMIAQHKQEQTQIAGDLPVIGHND